MKHLAIALIAFSLAGCGIATSEPLGETIEDPSAASGTCPESQTEEYVPHNGICYRTKKDIDSKCWTTVRDTFVDDEWLGPDVVVCSDSCAVFFADGEEIVGSGCF